MNESSFKVLEFSKTDFEVLIRNTVASEFSKLLEKLKVSEFNNKSEFMTREEVSELCNVSFVTLHNWEKRKYLQSRKIGGRVLYLREDVYQKLKMVA